MPFIISSMNSSDARSARAVRASCGAMTPRAVLSVVELKHADKTSPLAPFKADQLGPL